MLQIGYERIGVKEASMGRLPEEIKVKFIDDGKDIKVFVGEVEFPFPVSELEISYSPEMGATYRIQAGNNTPKFSRGGQSVNLPQSVLMSVNNDDSTGSLPIMQPSATGLADMEDGDSRELDAVSLTKLKSLVPDRDKVFQAAAPKGTKIVNSLSVISDEFDMSSDSTTIDRTMPKLIQSLADEENAIVDMYIDDKKHVLVPYSTPTVVYEGDKVFLEERVAVYERATY